MYVVEGFGEAKPPQIILPTLQGGEAALEGGKIDFWKVCNPPNRSAEASP
jgi:hypothetical protein